VQPTELHLERASWEDWWNGRLAMWNEPDFRRQKPDCLHPSGSPRRATTCNPCLSNTKDPYIKNKTDRVQHLFITLIRVHLFGTCRVQVHQDWIKQKENV
jgi:hypothetical protein